ncbi:MAG: hypothetical protein AAF589_08030 [Planctomycetota bacterium]
MSNHPLQTSEPTVAKPLAPEDIAPGDYVAVLDRQFEFPAVVWYADRSLAGEDQVIRLRLRPREPSGPLRVVEVCLPFVFVQTPKGGHQTLDIREVHLARLDAECSRRVCKALESRSSGKSKAKKKRRNA